MRRQGPVRYENNDLQLSGQADTGFTPTALRQNRAYVREDPFLARKGFRRRGTPRTKLQRDYSYLF